MAWTLYRYILKELVKLLVVSTTVGVVVIAIAAAIKPLSDGLLGPVAMVKFVLCMIPTMLGFALPFAAAFSTTLVFHRLAQDNEIIACRAGGMSYWEILLPVAVLGFVLMLGMSYLNNLVIPQYYLVAERMLEKDMLSLLVSKLQSGREPFRMKDLVLYADAADAHQPVPTSDDPNIRPQRLVVLRGVAVGRVDKAGKLVSDGSAQRAELLLYHDQRGQPWIMLRLKDFIFYSAEDRDQGARFETFEFGPFRLPSLFKDRPRFLSWPQLKELGRKPEGFDKVRLKKQRLATQIGAQRVLHLAEAALGSTGHAGELSLLGPAAQDKYLLSAPVVRRKADKLTMERTPEVPVVLKTWADGVPEYIVNAQTATLDVVPDPTGKHITLKLRLRLGSEDTIKDLRTGRENHREELVYPRLRLTQPVLPPLMELAVADLRETALADYNDIPMVRKTRRKLDDEVFSLRTRIVGKLHERGATALGCLLVTVLGAVLSIRMQGRMALVAFFWSFSLAALSLVITHSGRHLLTSNSWSLWPEVVSIWSGDVLLVGVITATYLKLARN